ncbi:unnamed protein product [Ranitomeya imitator]|uniref:Protein canopy homolog 3 n=1 Tax=Ranitomeya imitator TaxID=111125 RepID=A0ABN9M258_9NEOB|nr:unnamed protein product [Ranitomeya imitator]
MGSVSYEDTSGRGAVTSKKVGGMSGEPADPIPRRYFCKYVALELKSSFEETSRTREVIDTRYGFLDGEKKQNKIKYTNSDIRLIEVTEGLCQRLLDYNLHKERTGSNRFAKAEGGTHTKYVIAPFDLNSHCRGHGRQGGSEVRKGEYEIPAPGAVPGSSSRTDGLRRWQLLPLFSGHWYRSLQ